MDYCSTALSLSAVHFDGSLGLPNSFLSNFIHPRTPRRPLCLRVRLDLKGRRFTRGMASAVVCGVKGLQDLPYATICCLVAGGAVLAWIHVSKLVLLSHVDFVIWEIHAATFPCYFRKGACADAGNYGVVDLPVVHEVDYQTVKGGLVPGGLTLRRVRIGQLPVSWRNKRPCSLKAKCTEQRALT